MTELEYYIDKTRARCPQCGEFESTKYVEGGVCFHEYTEVNCRRETSAVNAALLIGRKVVTTTLISWALITLITGYLTVFAKTLPLQYSIGIFIVMLCMVMIMGTFVVPEMLRRIARKTARAYAGENAGDEALLKKGDLLLDSP